jgi:hypothetical protein
MMKTLIWIAVLLFSTAAAHGQTPDGTPSSVVLQSCFMGTPMATWTKLKLTSDQLERLGRVQEACKEECDLPNVKKEDDPISHSDGSMVMTELKNILTMDQYAAWLAYCKGSSSDGASPK